MKKENTSLIIILTTSLLHEIHMARTLLASHGIPSYIMNENINLVYGMSVFEGYKLQVKLNWMQRKRMKY